MEVIEQYLNSKTGDLATCEDAIFVNEHFAAVIDGVTSKSERRWDGLTTGQVAAQLVLETLPGLDPAITALDAFATINQAFRDLYEKVGRITELEKDPVERCAACVLIYSRQHHQVWSVGDSQALVDGQLFGRTKPSDDLLANVRAFYLETELLLGKSIEELQENDTGREFINPLIKRDRLFQNNPDHPNYESWVMDGFLDPALGVVVFDLPELTEFLVLASDGYPEVFSTLDETEKRLAEILACDPLLFREFKSTKGLQKGQISFDDRSYLRLRLHNPNRD